MHVEQPHARLHSRPQPLAPLILPARVGSPAGPRATVPPPSPGLLADRGGTRAFEPGTTDGSGRWLAVGRMGNLRTGGGFSLWFQLRGSTRIQAREGSFTLVAGEWLALDRDSGPELQAGRHGATLGVLLPLDASGARRNDLLPGRGRMSRRDLRIAIRLWRNGREADPSPAARREDAAARALSSMLLHFAGLQSELDGVVSRCPGRSVRRKRQVFGRMQRARLFLDGHRDRVVRLTELAELTSFSSWYLSKTFHDIYDESPQAASVRLRLERACELLATTDYAISEIGAACGFDNSCSFARAFRARFRTTASAYRIASRGDVAADRDAKIGIGTKPAAQSATATRTVMWSGA
jgi:AraC family transcriptional regulator